MIIHNLPKHIHAVVNNLIEFCYQTLIMFIGPDNQMIFILLLSVPERALICFRLSFLAAAATLWSPLNISLIIRRFQTIFGSYIL